MTTTLKVEQASSQLLRSKSCELSKVSAPQEGTNAVVVVFVRGAKNSA